MIDKDMILLLNIISIWLRVAIYLSCGILAKRKNRSVLLWILSSLFGGMLTFFVIALMPKLCHGCKKSLRKHDGDCCSKCGAAIFINESRPIIN